MKNLMSSKLKEVGDIKGDTAFYSSYIFRELNEVSIHKNTYIYKKYANLTNKLAGPGTGKTAPPRECCSPVPSIINL